MTKAQQPPSATRPKATKAGAAAHGPVVLSGYDAWMPNLVTLGSTRKTHDLWNMVMLPTIVLFTLQHLVFKTATTYQPWVILCYFIIDTSWMLVDPGAVRSPFEIFCHHLGCLALSIANVSFPYFFDSWSYAVIVEFNTVFLIAQRMFKPGPIQFALRLLCIVTWVPCRATPMIAFFVMGSQMIRLGLAPLWQVVPLYGAVFYLLYLQVQWTRRIVAGPIFSDVVDTLFGTSLGAKRRKEGDAVANEGL